MGRTMRSLVLLYILVLCTACAPLGVPAAATSPTRIATQTPRATEQPTATPIPTSTTTPARLPPSPTSMFAGVIDNVTVDRQGTLYASGYGASSDGSQHIAEWDGATWIALGDGVGSAGGNELVTDSANQLYTTVIMDPDQSYTTGIVRWDGAAWEDITGDFSTVVDALKPGRISSNIPVEGMAVDGEDNLYAAGSFQYPSADHTMEWPMGFVAKWDQETWTVLGHGFDQVHIYAMAVSTSGKVYISGEQPRIPPNEYSITGFIAEWDGETWTEIGTSELDPCFNIRNLALDPAGGLYASCIWSEAGEFIFHWDGMDWTTIAEPDQLQGEAPAVLDMAVAENGHLYIGGSFNSVNGVPAQNIAYWDGNGWHALRDGLKGQVYGLAFDPDGDLYAAGLLMEAGGQYAGLAARWDGETWHALGPQG